MAGHVIFWYKWVCTWRGDGSVTQDLQEVGLLEAHTGSDVSGAFLQLEPTAFNCIKHVHLCVILRVCSNPCAQVFQESLGVPPTPQLTLPPQDCCAFGWCPCALYLQ